MTSSGRHGWMMWSTTAAVVGSLLQAAVVVDGFLFLRPSKPRHFAVATANTPRRTSSSLSFVAKSTSGDDDDDDDDQDNDDGTAAAEKSTTPYVIGVTLKIALDAQGGVAELDTTQSTRFTSPASLDMVHRLRRASDAVLVGRGTVQIDDPSLTVRRVPPLVNNNSTIQPLRVVLDPSLSIVSERLEEGTNYQLLEDGLATVLYHSLDDVDTESLEFLADPVQLIQLPTTTTTTTSAAQDPEQPETPTGENVREISTPKDLLSILSVMSDLSQRFHVKHLMVEGGPATALSFLQVRLIDRALLVRAPLEFRQPLASNITSRVLSDAGLECLGSYPCGGDTVECWSRPHLPWPTPDDLEAWP